MERSMTLKVVVPKGQQVAANVALQAVGLASYEEWATSVEGMLVERKAYVKDVRTRYKEFSKTNGAYIFQMKFIGTEGQLFNIFHTPGLADALKLVDPYAAAGIMGLHTTSGHYYIGYGGGVNHIMNLPPLSDATPRPGPPVPSAPARATSTPNPFTEPALRMAPVVEAVSEQRNGSIIDTSDSILTLNVIVSFNTKETEAESFEDSVISEWVHFYDEVALPVEKKTYDIKLLGGTGVNLKATFRTHVDKYADVFTEEALYHLEQAVYHANYDIFYVEMPMKNHHDSMTYYVKNYSEYIRVGKHFKWSFGGQEGGDVNQELLPPIQVAQVVSRQEVLPPSPKEETTNDKVVKRISEMEADTHILRGEVSELKKARTKLNGEINEKEARIRAFEFACDELRDLLGF